MRQMILIGLFVAAVMGATSWAEGSIPYEINYQGHLTDDAGVAVTGALDFEFRIYDMETGGTALWTESHPGVDVTEGLFNIVLGSMMPIDPEMTGIDFDGEYWLEVMVEGETLTPRQMFTSSGQTYRAEEADDVYGRDIHPNSVFIENYGMVIDSSGAWVGDPAGLSGPTGPAGATGPEGPAGPTGPVAGSDKQVIYNNGGSAGGAEVYYDAAAGNLGVGTTTPVYKLSVQGDCEISGDLVGNGYRILGDAWEPFFGLGMEPEYMIVFNWDIMPLLQIRANPNPGILFYDAGASPGHGYSVLAADNDGFVFGKCDFTGWNFTPHMLIDENGNVNITGNLSKGGGSFKIDHPLEPESKYLYHSFVESPDMKNIYDGTAVLDDSGEAWVELPEWFEALNKDFRYQLTAVGKAAPALHVAQKIEENRFKIAGGEAGMEVCWMVTGIRHDPYAEAHRIPVEEDKSEDKVGTYLHPDVYGKAGPLSEKRRITVELEESVE